MAAAWRPIHIIIIFIATISSLKPIVAVIVFMLLCIYVSLWFSIYLFIYLPLNTLDSDLLDEISQTAEVSEYSHSPIIPARQLPWLHLAVLIPRCSWPSGNQTAPTLSGLHHRAAPGEDPVSSAQEMLSIPNSSLQPVRGTGTPATSEITATQILPPTFWPPLSHKYITQRKHLLPLYNTHLATIFNLVRSGNIWPPYLHHTSLYQRN